MLNLHINKTELSILYLDVWYMYLLQEINRLFLYFISRPIRLEIIKLCLHFISGINKLFLLLQVYNVPISRFCLLQWAVKQYLLN